MMLLSLSHSAIFIEQHVLQTDEREKDSPVINQVRSQIVRHSEKKAGNCQLTTANKTQHCEYSELKIPPAEHKGYESTWKQTDTNWIKQLKRHNMLFRNRRSTTSKNWLEPEINRNNLKTNRQKQETRGKNRCQGKWH